jgi:hypothetical protein
MGILDDAIREHLELKRKHGVPEEEVERQQEEALGPARREVAQQHEDAEIAAEEAAPTDAPEGSGPIAVEDAALFDGEQPGPAVAEEPSEVDATPAAGETAVAEPSVAEHESALAEPRPADAPADPSAADEPDREPDAYDALGDTEPHGFPAVDDDEEQDEDEDEDEDLVDSDSEQDDPDVLEDTPDFLQETPEHDRLWFEQKPPRDFDFD